MFQKSNLFSLCLFGLISLLFTSCTPESLEILQTPAERISNVVMKKTPEQIAVFWADIEQQYKDGFKVILFDLDGTKITNPSKEEIEKFYTDSNNTINTKFFNLSSTNNQCFKKLRVIGETEGFNHIEDSGCDDISFIYSTPDMCFDIEVSFDAGEEHPATSETGSAQWEFKFNTSTPVSGTLTETGTRIWNFLTASPCYG